MSIIPGGGPGFFDRHAPARYQGSLPEYQGRVGCLLPDEEHPGRSVLVLWAWNYPAVPGATLRNVRRESIDTCVTVDPMMRCPCGLLD